MYQSAYHLIERGGDHVKTDSEYADPRGRYL